MNVGQNLTRRQLINVACNNGNWLLWIVLVKNTYVIWNVPKCYELIMFEQEIPQKLSHGPSGGDWLAPQISSVCFVF